MRRWLKIIGVAVVALTATGYLALQYIPPAIANSAFISVNDAREMLADKPNMLILDVRTPAEFHGNLGHLKGAKNIDFRAISAALRSDGSVLDLPKSTPIIVHCHTDVRSSIAARTLRQAGFNNITVIDDGIVAWRNAKFPVVYSKPQN